MKAVTIAAVMACVLAPLALAQAQEKESAALYPSRPVTFVVPFAPGGSTGLIARVVGQKLEQRLGKPFIIDHRAGGGGVIGVTQVAHGVPDGYTIMMASSTALAINATSARRCRMIHEHTPTRCWRACPLAVGQSGPAGSRWPIWSSSRQREVFGIVVRLGRSGIHHSTPMFKSIFNIDVVHVPY